ncbi:MAG: F0F1 ATP synthase subunit gamma [Lysobacterales bacterium]
MNKTRQIHDRLSNVREIETIVSTLRALAVAHQQEARTHLEAIRAHETSVAAALSTALSMLPGTAAKASEQRGMAIVVGAAQGFSGTFADRIADAALIEHQRGSTLLAVGTRTLSALQEREVAPVWSSEAALHASEVPDLANQLADVLFERLAQTPEAEIVLLYADAANAGQTLIRRILFPFDFGRFPRSTQPPPLTTLPAAALLSALVSEYVFAELCEALMMGFAAENAARAAAMSRAQSNVKQIASELQNSFQRARQEQMTTEIIELSLGKL